MSRMMVWAPTVSTSPVDYPSTLTYIKLIYRHQINYCTINNICGRFQNVIHSFILCCTTPDVFSHYLGRKNLEPVPYKDAKLILDSGDLVSKLKSALFTCDTERFSSLWAVPDLSYLILSYLILLILHYICHYLHVAILSSFFSFQFYTLVFSITDKERPVHDMGLRDWWDDMGTRAIQSTLPQWIQGNASNNDNMKFELLVEMPHHHCWHGSYLATLFLL